MKHYPLLKLPALLKAREPMGDPTMEYLLVVEDSPFTSTVTRATQAGMVLPSSDPNVISVAIHTYLKQELLAVYDVVKEGL